MLTLGREFFGGLHLGLIMVAEGGHHAQVSFPIPSVAKTTIVMASPLIFQLC